MLINSHSVHKKIGQVTNNFTNRVLIPNSRGPDMICTNYLIVGLVFILEGMLNEMRQWIWAGATLKNGSGWGGIGIVGRRPFQGHFWRILETVCLDVVAK